MMSKEANQEVEIARCHRGQYFGELALVTNKPRAASAYAVGEVKCLGKQMFSVCIQLPVSGLLQFCELPLTDELFKTWQPFGTKWSGARS